MPLRCVQHPRAWLTLYSKVNEMNNVEQIKKDFREARIVGEHLLSSGKISWEQYAFSMVGYEMALRELGVDL